MIGFVVAGELGCDSRRAAVVPHLSSLRSCLEGTDRVSAHLSFTRRVLHESLAHDLGVGDALCVAVTAAIREPASARDVSCGRTDTHRSANWRNLKLLGARRHERELVRGACK
jgi:hypothetical protein